MHNRLPLFRNVIIGLLLLILGGSIGFRFGQTGALPLNAQRLLGSKVGNITNQAPPQQYEDVSFATFWEVWGKLQESYLRTDKLVPVSMVNGAIAGMTAALEDPYTVYLPPADNVRTTQDLAGKFYGVGIELGYIENTLAVIAPLQDMPADKAGVQAGDLILHVKDPSKNFDQDTAGWSLSEAVEHIRGDKDTDVTLTLFRQNTETPSEAKPFDVTLARGEVIVKTVDLEFVEHNGKRVAHIKVSRFGERTPGEWDRAVNQILENQQNLTGVVVDLRNNPGGFFDGAIALSSEFIESGVVVIQKGKFSQQEYEAIGEARLANIPLVVIVNKGSASASEIMAGALRDQRNVKLIGEKTFGKGTVQDQFSLSNGGGMHVTIAEWLTPNGDLIHEKGIAVDVEANDNLDTPEDELLFTAIEQI